MNKTFIPIEIKMACVEAAESGVPYETIYNDIYACSIENPQSLRSFKTTLGRWRNKDFSKCDSYTLNKGTYENFTAHDATVQVNARGEVVHAWIKQKADAIDVDKFLEAVKTSVEKYEKPEAVLTAPAKMLEIPLFDMHWGINYLVDYEKVLNEILELIYSHRWSQIIIPFGQDFFHNDSIVNPQTTKGTIIEKVDMVKAVNEGKQFMFALIEAALDQSTDVKVLYSCGNHDLSISWMFTQVLKTRYGEEIVDDSIEYRKCVAFGQNAIMFTHGNSKQATAKNLAHMFPIAFPYEFGLAKVREVHAGHLHHETEADIFGVMVRRLSSGSATSNWTDREDFIGTHKRFMLFEYDINKLKTIYYI